MKRSGFQKIFPMASIIPQKKEEKWTHKDWHIDTTKLLWIGVKLSWGVFLSLTMK